MNNLSNIATLLGSWANQLPANVRKNIYKSVKILAGVATLALLILPELPGLGVNLPSSARWDALFTAALTFLGQLADRNTFVDPPLESAPAPEVNPKDAAAPVNEPTPDTATTDPQPPPAAS